MPLAMPSGVDPGTMKAPSNVNQSQLREPLATSVGNPRGFTDRWLRIRKWSQHWLSLCFYGIDFFIVNMFFTHAGWTNRFALGRLFQGKKKITEIRASCKKSALYSCLRPGSSTSLPFQNCSFCQCLTFLGNVADLCPPRCTEVSFFLHPLHCYSRNIGGMERGRGHRHQTFLEVWNSDYTDRGCCAVMVEGMGRRRDYTA